MKNPRLWWPLNKGPQNLYEAKFTLRTLDGKTKKYVQSDALQTRFGIREITSDQNSPDRSRTFYVNGKRFFVRGSNWIPDALLRDDDARIYAQLRYTAQAGVNFLREWGGGIAESDYFFQLCDELGILVWQDSGDRRTRHPVRLALYREYMAQTGKRIRSHASLGVLRLVNESTRWRCEELIA
jgi:beta-galactosidase/beta-glucuronidase